MAKRGISQDSIFTRVEKLIERNDISNLEFQAQSEEFKEAFTKPNLIAFKVNELQLDLLSLSAYHSSFDCFKFIHLTLQSSPNLSDLLLYDQSTSLIEIICTRGNKDLLEYYLPLYTPIRTNSAATNKTESLTFTSDVPKQLPKVHSAYTPIQKACEQGNINIIAYVYKYFQDKPVPYQLDLDYQDEADGENCALIACRRANYTMIKFLHSNCHCNFRILNKQGENALQVLAATNKKRSVKDFHEIFVYLVNLAGVDILYNYEETLLLITCDKTIAFFEKKLKDRGIELDKVELEERNKIVRVEQLKSIVEEKIENFEGRNYNFCALYEEVMDKDDEISVIGTENRAETPFSSILGNI